MKEYKYYKSECTVNQMNTPYLLKKVDDCDIEEDNKECYKEDLKRVRGY